MASRPKVLVSHTAKDRRDHKLAHQIAEGLQSRGAEVWIAPDSIPAGAKWEDAIVSGIMGKCTHFLVLLSAASTNAEWVLAEIQLAKQRYERDPNFVILPLVVGKLGRFRGKKFIDGFQAVPFHDDFSAQLDALASQLALAPTIPDRFRTFVDAKTKEFVGRDFVFSAIDEFLRREDRGYLTLQGDPGEGKSAILAQYVKRTGCVAHFNIRAEGITSAGQFQDGVSGQLVTRYGLAKSGAADEKAGVGGRLRRLLEEASAQLGTDDRLVIAIDALDEVDQTDLSPGVNVLYLPSVLPEKVYFIMTRRRVSAADMSLYVTCPQEVLDLMDYKAECTRDIQTYIRLASKQQRLQTWILSRKLSVDEFVQALAQKSERNFMYLYYVLPEIRAGAYQDLSIQELPVGLRGYYEDHWHRMGMQTKPLKRNKLNILYILCEVREPVSRDLLLDFAREGNCHLDAVQTQEVLDEWRQFLHLRDVDGKLRYAVYHSSFREFLYRKDIVKAAGVTIQGINNMIANNLWRDLYPEERHCEGESTRNESAEERGRYRIVS